MTPGLFVMCPSCIGRGFREVVDEMMIGNVRIPCLECKGQGRLNIRAEPAPKKTAWDVLMEEP